MKQPRGCSNRSLDSFAEFTHNDQYDFSHSLFPFSLLFPGTTNLIKFKFIRDSAQDWNNFGR